MRQTVSTIDETIKTEQWQRGDLVHRVLTVTEHGKTAVYDQVLGADGVLRNRLPEGTVQETRTGDRGEAGDILSQERNDPISRFRSAYAAGALTDAGATTFDGRPAHAYTRTTSERPRPVKLGNRTIDMGVQRMTDTFYLDPTPENLAKLSW